MIWNFFPTEPLICRTLEALLVAGLSLGTIAACDSNDGPMEEAGEEIDNAVEETADAVEDSTDH